MKNQTNSIAYNLNKLRKYQMRLAESTDPNRKMVYNQKVQFYQNNLKGAGINDSTLGNGPTAPNNEVNSLISKIDSLIQKSRSTRQSITGHPQSGGFLNKVNGHRVMTGGSQMGGTLEDELREAGYTRPEPERAVDAQRQQEEAVEAINESFEKVIGVSADKTDKISALEDQIDQLKRRIDQLLAAKGTNDAAARELESKIDDLTDQLAAVTAARDAALIEKADLENRVAELEAEVAKHEQTIRELEAKIAEYERLGAKELGDGDRPDKLRGDIADLRDQVADLERALEEARAKAAEDAARIAELEAENTELKEEIERLRREKGEAEASSGEKAAEVADLTAKIAELRGYLKQLMEDNNALTEENADKEAQLNAYRNNLTELSEAQGEVTPVEPLTGDYVLTGGGNLDELLLQSVQVPEGF